jgi:hypothetical protein
MNALEEGDGEPLPSTHGFFLAAVPGPHIPAMSTRGKKISRIYCNMHLLQLAAAVVGTRCSRAKMPSVGE